MNCTDYRELLAAYVEGLLDETQLSEIEAHLRNCPSCTEELAAIQGLHGRLVADGKTYEAQDVENKVIDRIFREQQFQLRRAEEAGQRIRLRRLIMSRFGKLAMAAVLVAAIGLGIVLLQGTGSVTLAQVEQLLAKIESFTYRAHITLVGMPGMAADQKMETDTTMVMSTQYGMRMESRVNGEVASKTYLDPAAGVMISLMPSEKKYMKFTLTPQLLEDTRQQNADPRRMVQTFLKAGHTDLGRRTVNGIRQQGFECRHSSISAGMADNAVGEIWVDAETGLPVEMTIRGGLKDMQMEVVCTGFEWNVPCKAEDFAVEIPADYQPMGEFNLGDAASGEQLIEGLRFWVELSGGKYPRSLAPMSLAQEMGDLQRAGEAGKLPQADGGDATQYMAKLQEKMLKLQMGAAYFAVLTATGKDPAYYGETVGPQDAGKVLVRWKQDNGSYKVIYGDLRSEDVTAERLAELEQK